jgi:Fur family peroxide stress response transcriptional regulator
MEITQGQIKEKLVQSGLKVTPQRMAVLEAVYELDNHPTADMIIDHIRKVHPGVATGTVYNVLDVLVENSLIKRVKTDKDAMRYDGILDKHHHLYCTESDRIEDYFDEDLDHLLREYFRKKAITDFDISDIVLQLKGNFKQKK